jgi:hypothetical protein
MEKQAPKIDKRNFDGLLEDFSELIPSDPPGSKPFEAGVGLGLKKIFCRMMETLVQRLNRVPEKHFAAFLDTIGVSLLPPQAALAPVTFFLSEGTGEHVLVPEKTQVAAGDIIFETQKNILATPAKLTALYRVVPVGDKIIDHSAELAENKSINISQGDNLQEHILYLGHKDLFNITGQADINLTFNPAFTNSTDVSWEYFGENSAGVEDWHTLDISSNGNPVVLTKSEEGEIKENEINGIKSRWIRCRVESSQIDSVKDYQLDTVSVTAIPSVGAFLPDMAFYNDVPLDLTIENGTFKYPIYPFGKIPRINDTFYIACKEAFSKKGAQVTLDISITGGASDFFPLLSWEYWNGKGWLEITGIVDHTDSFTTTPDQPITFTCPGDIQPTVINGQENSWIRVRLVGGDYGKEFVINGGEVESGTVTPPEITSLTITYGYGGNQQDLEHVFIYNNLEFQDVNIECKTGNNIFNPFQEFAKDHKALFLGFDQRMEKGPISIFFSINEEKQIQQGTGHMPKIRWYCPTTDPDNPWEKLDTVDNTQNLTCSGTVEFLLPPGFIKTKKFGKEMYWLKAVVKENNTDKFPLIENIHINTVFALQAESVENEILGSGTGTGGKKFQTRKAPVMDETVWIDETGFLTDEEKEFIIKENGEDSISEIKDETGKTTRIWVRWQPKQDFLGSSAKDRHYVMDGASGQITFGSGVQGKIPPRGRDNIKISYRIGGGRQGNVKADEITTIKTSLPFVDTVTNKQPAQGGSDTEQLSGVFERGPHLIKHRNRAVTIEDFQRLSREASVYVARSQCVEQDNKLKIIIIPKDVTDKPMPSPTLLKTVKKYILQRSLNTILPGSIQVLPPEYTAVSVTVDVVPTSIDIAVPLEKEILTRLKQFFHPLTGGPGKNGWESGRDVHISDIYAMLESIEGVDHTANLLLNNGTDDVTVQEGKTVCSGTHDITMKFGG